MILQIQPITVVHTASSGEIGLQMINEKVQSGECYDLLITDN